jgi:predicted ATPase
MPVMHRHVPVGDDEVEVAGLQNRPRAAAVVGLGGVGIAEIVQQVFHDTTHRGVVVNDQNLGVFVHGLMGC